VMHTGDEIPAVAADATLAQALVEMSRKRLGMTAVVDGDNTLLGIFTDGDLRRALDTAGLDIHATAIASVMTRNPVTINAQALATEAARLLETRNIGSGLIVVDAQGRVTGALNVHDLLRARVV
jgi:arabinose-5-phosphate isomerase